MTDDRPLIIANPQSAGGSLGRRWGEISAKLEAILGPLDHRFTTSMGDGARLSREALGQGRRLVVAMGGDGTISEVAGAMSASIFLRASRSWITAGSQGSRLS